MECSCCGADLKSIKVNIRQHIGCPAGCGGIMKAHVAGMKCPICGIFISTKFH